MRSFTVIEEPGGKWKITVYHSPTNFDIKICDDAFQLVALIEDLVDA